jgi:hypothetical protein
LASPEQAEGLIAFYREKLEGTPEVEGVQDRWFDHWNHPSQGWPNGVPAQFMHINQLDNHMLNWCVDTIGEVAADAKEPGQVRLLGRFTAIVFYRSKELCAAFRKEVNAYLRSQWREKVDAIYRKHPEYAPDGWAEEQAEAAGQPVGATAAETPEPPWQEGRE